MHIPRSAMHKGKLLSVFLGILSRLEVNYQKTPGGPLTLVLIDKVSGCSTPRSRTET